MLAVASGNGLTVTITTTGVPAQLPAVGVIVYVAVPCTATVVLNAWAMLAPLPAAAPVTPACTTVQLNVVPATAFGLVMVMFVDAPLQMTCEAGVVDTFGVGSTTAFTSKVAPSQPAPLRGVILYTTVCCTFVGFTNVCAIVAPLPAVAPVTPPVLLCTTQV